MSTDYATNITPCAARDKEGDGAREDIAAKQLTLQIEDLSIEKKAGDVLGEGNIPAMASTNNANNTDKITTTCAACGKEGDAESMNICNKCKVAKYCNAACKKKHRHKHKANCNEIVKRAAELHDKELFKQPPPPEDCPICMIPLPLDPGQSTFEACCGKLICYGCIFGMIEEEAKRGKKVEEWGMCAFCRTLRPSSDEEKVKRLKKLMEKGDANAFFNFAAYHAKGVKGMLRLTWVKANELYLKAGELGCSMAYFNLGNSYYHGRGVEVDEKKAKHYYELAAIGGDIDARHYLGCVEEEVAGNHQRALKHFIISARAGDNESLDKVKQGFRSGHVTKDEFESTLRAYHEIQTEMKSEARDKAVVFMEERRAQC